MELWPREAPLACKNFILHALHGYYDNNIFHRIIKGAFAQTGDPTGTGRGGESIYGKPFKDEVHGRIKFDKRGQVACANEQEPNSNHSQFFITFAPCEWLNKKNTIFGKVTGQTIFNLLRMSDVDVDADDRPHDDIRVIGVEVISNPFPDIMSEFKYDLMGNGASSGTTKSSNNKSATGKASRKAVLDTKLVSFGDDDDEDGEMWQPKKKKKKKLGVSVSSVAADFVLDTANHAMPDGASPGPASQPQRMAAPAEEDAAALDTTFQSNKDKLGRLKMQLAASKKALEKQQKQGSGDDANGSAEKAEAPKALSLVEQQRALYAAKGPKAGSSGSGSGSGAKKYSSRKSGLFKTPSVSGRKPAIATGKSTTATIATSASAIDELRDEATLQKLNAFMSGGKKASWREGKP